MKDGWAFLWKEKVSKLLLKFSIPCIISFIVNALYNIVDQIFIWRGVDYLANGATNIVFPLMMVCLWFALLFWDWSASYLSLKLWEKKKEEAAKWVANGISMSVLVSVIFAILWYLFLPQLLNLFWCTDALRDYAMTYGSIIMLWVPFVMIWVTLNSIIRADWNPKFAMLSMIAGAVINTILDWWFIFGLGLWIAWAAYATIISQFITFVLNAWYVSKLNTVSLTRKSFHIDFWTTAKIMWLWISSFINQISIVAVMAVSNNLLVKYWALSKFWSEIPITVIWIVMKVNMILTSIIIWVSVGSQPIVWYNYWAKNFDRVKEALKLVLKTWVTISIIAFILFQSIPEKIIWIFGNWDELYIEFACLAFRIFLFFCVWMWVQIPAWVFFQSIWKSKISAFLSLSRQVIILIPAFFILGHTFWIMGILYAWATADFIALLLAIYFLSREIKKLNRKHSKRLLEKKDSLKENEIFFWSELFEVVCNRSLISHVN